MEALFRPENQIVEAVKAPKIEKYVPPISEFRTGLEIFHERYGCSPQKWYEADQARRGI